MNDPYFDESFCIDRLYNEYQKYGKLIVAVDFDDTVFDYHGKGYQYNRVFDLLKICQSYNFYICVFTGSPKDKYEEIRSYMDERGVKITSINENPFPMPFGNNGKMYYNILLDDRAGLGQSYKTLSAVVNKIKNS